MERPPLWLPHGSVRAVLAVLIVGAALWATIKGVDHYEALLTLAGTIIGFYFRQREGEEDRRAVIKMAQQANGGGGLPRADRP